MNKKAVKIWVFILLLWPISNASKAENNREAVMEFNETDAIVLSANMLINGSMGGTGAYLTVYPNAKLSDFPKMMKSRIYWQGFYQGAIGGSLVYTGMKTMIMQPEFEYSVLAGKQISDLGTSITYSASENQNWLDNPSYLTDIGPLVLHWRKSTGWKPNVYILPGSLTTIIYNFTAYNFEPELSLKTGLFLFSGNVPIINGRELLGLTTTNTVVVDYSAISDWYPITKSYKERSVLGHEAIHTRWNYFTFMPMDIVVDNSLNRLPDQRGMIKLYHLKYQNQPFRFGADIYGGTMYLIDLATEDLYSSYDVMFREYPSYHLFNKSDY